MRGERSQSAADILRIVAIAAGLAAAVLFIVVALSFRLQEFADGSMFSYSVAVRDAWAFHWHNISGRAFVYLLCFAPAEAYVALTRDPAGGIVLYGFLFYAAPLAGLALTFAADRSRGRIIFAYACASTACVCPIVFGFPTEMWVAHAVFWPTLATTQYARRGAASFVAITALMLALVQSHGGGVLFAIAILCTLLLRGVRDPVFVRGIVAFVLAMIVWMVVKRLLPPDNYFGSIMMTAALEFIDVSALAGPFMALLATALAAYLLLCWAFDRRLPENGSIVAVVVVAAGLAVYWLRFDHAMLADRRYIMRTALLILAPILGAFAASFALRDEGRLKLRLPLLPWLLQWLGSAAAARVATGIIPLVVLIHTVEADKFATAWADYRSAVGALAMSEASDPALGDPRFVSSARIDPSLNRLSWFSTTPYLSVLAAPGFAPKRLVVDARDPSVNYFWLSCATATANARADRAVPQQSRELVRIYSCLHRR